jgi:hypothetical protein
MSCPIYELDDLEITLINANYLLLDNATGDLRILVGGLPLVSNKLRNRVLSEITRLDTALNNLRPLITHLYELQGKTQ